MSTADVVDSAELEALGDIPIDDVLAAMDRPPPGYRDLYYQWERQQWQSTAIDFSIDRRQWGHEIPAELKRSLLWALASFYVAEEQVTHNLVPFVDAAPTEEHQVFLATQLVDEARHTVFFDLFFREVLNEEGADMGARLGAQVDRLNPGLRTLLLEMLPTAADRIRDRAEDLDALVEGVMLYHILIEATLALTGQRFLLNFIRDSGLLPGFRRGFTAVARDETRHVGFGVRFLAEMVERDRRYAEVINKLVEEFTPIGLSVIQPPDGDLSYFDPLPCGPDDLRSFALNSLAKRLQSIGAGSSR